MNANCYLFLKTPLPIQATKKISRVEKDVWSAVFTLREINKRRTPTVKRIAAVATNGDRRNAKRALLKLESLGLISARKKRTPGGYAMDYRSEWPDWIEEEGRRFLLKEKNRSADVEGEEYFDDKYPEDVPISPENEGEGVRHSDAGGVGQGDAGGVGQETPPFKTIETKEEILKQTGVPFADEEETWDDPPEDDEEEDLNPDGDSRTGKERLAAERDRRKKGRKKKVRKASGSDLAETPSERWEFQVHRGKPVRTWGGIDIIGYWVSRFREVWRKEDPMFFVSGVDAVYVRRCARNSKLFVKNHLGGDNRRAKEAIDGILEHANERGRPVSLAYYFTPKSDSALREVLGERGLSRPPREKTLREMNNESGSKDLDYWREESERCRRKRMAKRKREEAKKRAAGEKRAANGN